MPSFQEVGEDFLEHKTWVEAEVRRSAGGKFSKFSGGLRAAPNPFTQATKELNAMSPAEKDNLQRKIISGWAKGQKEANSQVAKKTAKNKLRHPPRDIKGLHSYAQLNRQTENWVADTLSTMPKKQQKDTNFLMAMGHNFINSSAILKKFFS